MGRSEHGEVFYWNAHGSAVKERRGASGQISYEPPNEQIRCSGDLVKKLPEGEVEVAIDDMNEQTEQKAFHWLVVGYVSPAARAWIEAKGGQLRDLSSDPPLVGVALAYDPAGVWVWQHGEQQHRVGVEIWNNGYIEEASSSIMLQYGAVTGGAAELASVTDTYILLPDEDFDAQARQVVEHEPDGTDVGQSSEPALVSDEGGDPYFPD